MIKTIEKDTRTATMCKSCSRILTNPGYGKQNVFCCGKYQQWYKFSTITIVKDDGRNSKGQFCKKPKIISRETKIWAEGGA